MAEDLFIRIGPAELEWLLLDHGSGVIRVRGHGGWDEFGALVSGITWEGGTHVFVSGEDVFTTSATVPSRQRRQVIQAIPYMVEEQLACDVDQCHFAVGPRLDDGSTAVAVVSRTLIEDWLDQLSSIGLTPDTLTADAVHVPHVADVTVLLDGGRALFRAYRTTTSAIEVGALPLSLSLHVADDDTEIVVGVDPDADGSEQMITAQIEAGPGQTRVETLSYSPFEMLCRSFDRAAINLLQGDFHVKPRRPEVGSPWKAVAVLAGVALVLHLMLLVAQGIYLELKANEYEGEIKALYADVFPNDRNPRDIGRRWRSRINAGSGNVDDGFFDVFAEAARIIPGSNLRLENVNFNEGRGDVSLQLAANQSSQFVQYSQRLSEAGLNAEVGTINQADDGARGNIRIRLR